MWIVRYIKNCFRIRSIVRYLKDQISKVKGWEVYVDKESMYDYFTEYSTKLYNIHKEVSYMSMEVSLSHLYLKDTKGFCMAPKLVIEIEFSCCDKLKIISNLWKPEPVKYAVFNKNKRVFSGEGELDDCIKEIKKFNKNG